MISVIIPVYKNIEEFVKNLKKNYPYLRGNEIIIVNDDPSMSIKEDLKEFKDIILLENSRNMGFGETVNKGVKHATRDILLFLNTDVILTDDSYKKAAEQFKKNPRLFGISFAQIEKDGSKVGKNIFCWKQGFFYHSKSHNQTTGLNGWAEGGSCLIDKKKFDELHGFDPLYSPFYWEDMDLSYRAWKKGYRVVFDASIVVEHHHGGTTGKYVDSDFKDTIAARNHYIFIWKNITDNELLKEHILSLPYNLLYFMFKKNKALIKGFFWAIPKIARIRKTRALYEYQLTDKEVFNLLRT
ncbi:MAG: glycosyltransferase family 2 protein [Patescibacteria group bacterium]